MALTLPRGEAAAGAVFVALASFVLWEANRMPAGAPGQPGPGFFPAILAVALLLCGVGLLLRSWRATRAAAPAEAISFRYPKVWITLVALAVMTFALEPLGFVVSATLFLFVLLRWCGEVRWVTAGVGAILIAGASWYFFVAALGVSLPHGVLRL